MSATANLVGVVVAPAGASTVQPAAPRRRGRPRRQPGPEGTAPPPRPVRPALSVRGVASRASDRARQVAAMVLEVFAAVRSPAEAAQALGVVPVRYYQLEARALAGLLRGCEPVGKGRPAAGAGAGGDATAGAELRSAHTRLQAEQQRLRAELGRLQALLRTARTAFGLRLDPAPPAPAGGRKEPGGAGGARARRKPRVRALRLAGLLKPAGLTPAAAPANLATNPAGG